MKNMTDAEAKKLLDLRPVKFDYITEEDGTDCYGLIAEEVQDAGIEYPVFTHHDKRLDEDVPVQQQEIDLLKQEVGYKKEGHHDGVDNYSYHYWRIGVMWRGHYKPVKQ